MTGSSISWFTPPIGVGSGYGYVAYKLITALQRKFVGVNFSDTTSYVHISYSQPTLYMGQDNQYRIGYTPWESTEISNEWIPLMKKRDEIWTTADFCVDVFNSYNVNDNIFKLPHGIGPEWEIIDREVADKFVFFHVGAPTQRKGAQKVVDAFLDLFEGDMDYHLLMKSNGFSDARVRYRGNFGNASQHPQITIVEQYLDEQDLIRLYSKAHCMVYPTNGEGWGLIPWQAIATGMPTICTNATGCTEFAGLSVPLASKRAKGYGIHLGDWVEPDVDDLRDKMLWVTDKYESIKESTLHSARVIHDTQRWEHVADMVLDRLGDKVKKLA